MNNLNEARKKKSQKWKLDYSLDTYKTIYNSAFANDQKELIAKALKTIEKNPYAKGTSKIKKSKKNARRIRAGEYRIIYRVRDYKHIVSVILVALRKDIQYDLLEEFQEEIWKKLILLDGN